MPNRQSGTAGEKEWRKGWPCRQDCLPCPANLPPSQPALLPTHLIQLGSGGLQPARGLLHMQLCQAVVHAAQLAAQLGHWGEVSGCSRGCAQLRLSLQQLLPDGFQLASGVSRAGMRSIGRRLGRRHRLPRLLQLRLQPLLLLLAEMGGACSRRLAVSQLLLRRIQLANKRLLLILHGRQPQQARHAFAAETAARPQPQHALV